MPIVEPMSQKFISHFFLYILISLSLLSCEGPEVIHNLSNDTFQLVNQDSSAITFPKDYEGTVLVVGFIYTHCPDICSIITAKLKNIKSRLNNTSDVHVAAITFDPVRDTPSVLKGYMQKFKLDSSGFSMLTGDSLTIDSLLQNMDVEAEIAESSSMNHEHDGYVINHTNRISIMDKQGRVRFEYPGSAASEKIVIEDINTLR